MKKPSVQEWSKSRAVGKLAIREVNEFLNSQIVRNSWYATEHIHNVEQDKTYQRFDIDLLWLVSVDGFSRCITIEVKGDRNYRTGNFFFETVSVKERNKPGAFVITRAEWLFYYFFEVEKLYCMPMRFVRPWFEANEGRLKETSAQSIDNNRLISWTTTGRLVPINKLIEEIPDLKIFQKYNNDWKTSD